MKSFIGWIGGKSHLKKQIIPLIPSDCDRYIEVCGGAGWVLFGKDKVKGQMEVLWNTLSTRLFSFKLQKHFCKNIHFMLSYVFLF